MIDAYAVYGASDAVIRAGTKFLPDFPNASNRTAVAIAWPMRTRDRIRPGRGIRSLRHLLVELAKRADGVPLGALPLPRKPATTRGATLRRSATQYETQSARPIMRACSIVMLRVWFR